MSNAAPERNWRGIVIALLVIVSVLGLIITAIVLVTPRTYICLVFHFSSRPIVFMQFYWLKYFVHTSINSKMKNNNRRGIMIVLLVIVSVFGLIIKAIALVTPNMDIYIQFAFSCPFVSIG